MEKDAGLIKGEVTSRATAGASGSPAFDADILGHGDLHVVDMGAVPKRLEERVGEAQRHEVLNRFFAEIMVDAVDLMFFENGANRFVDRLGGLEVFADRLFDHDPRVRGVQSVARDTLADRPEKLGIDGQIEDPNQVAVGGQPVLEFRPAVLAGTVDGHVAYPVDELRDMRRVAVFRRHEAFDRLACPGLEFLVRERAPGNRDDAARPDDLPGPVAVEQRRQQLTVGQVPGAAEDDQFERIDGNLLTLLKESDVCLRN